MKRLGLFVLLSGLALTACGSAPGQITGGGRVAVGISANDSGSSETATKTIIAATETTPAQIAWTITPGQGVTFTFMTNPGSDSVYITGYRILKQVISTIDGTEVRTDFEPVNKSNLYLTSGFTCQERTALRSCNASDADFKPANGLPGQLSIYLEGGLGSLAQVTNAGVSRVTNIEFFGKSSNGKAVTVTVDGVVSQGIRAGVE